MAKTTRIAYDPERQIVMTWDIDDVKGVRRDLNEAQCLEVLQHVKHYHDAEVGINWASLRSSAETLYPEPDTNEDTTFACPECGSRDLDQLEPTLYDSEQIMRVMKCTNCEIVFEVHYEQVRIERRGHARAS